MDISFDKIFGMLNKEFQSSLIFASSDSILSRRSSFRTLMSISEVGWCCIGCFAICMCLFLQKKTG